MIKLTVLYGHPLVPDDFEAYYRATHRPLLADVQGIQRAELTLFCTQADGSLPAYYRMAELYFATQAQMDTALASAAGQILVADIENFATGGVTVLVGHVAA
ncbi:MAG: EthD family reductase [Gammaproteobacteria bacterium]|nr:EthD family reductase [Gammaproteobacteria bacterium]